MSALPIYSPLEISKAVSAHAIALGFTKNIDGNFEFVSPLAAQLEKFFDLNLVDELTFFAPTGKAGGTL
jgi:leucyl aminopeptidase